MLKLDHTTMIKNPSMGWYEIGGEIYWDKASALLEGTKRNLRYKDLHWNFNDDVFGKFNWSEEPEGDIRNYYCLRAKQLREKYDYLILNLSGGSDSTTILYSFIQENLHLDEVVIRYAKEGTKNFKPDNKNFNASNEFSEFEYAGKPLLEWLSVHSPRTKITIHDFSQEILDSNLSWDENFIYWTGDYVTPGCIVRYNHFSNLDHLKTFDKGKRIGIIFGVDKPRLILEDDSLYVRFVDRPVHIALPATVNNGFSNLNVELFFWSPELPSLISKQAHLIKKWFELSYNKMHSYMLDPNWQINPMNRTIYEAFIKGIIYPDYDLRTFQTNKPMKAVYQEWDYWMDSFKTSNGYNTFMNGLSHLYQNIDHSFFKMPGAGIEISSTESKKHWEYRTCVSKKYFVGKFR